ncbi:uncharacterized protein BO72DRAFT_371571 [Aspergillus fijiensis CBS 313.89]|uniref:Arrestin-like N-terminal domain-containing protein n=1 Tax=Aspergillus fijiensis CBS 313.89 TaxID=1448319 RepID=A0A8G1W4J5_9EURO|nr:uncharacterized protein BO72DRAFT_371571 [Aspergillus fijiensis CBS 313.89]RAK80239.1 hypothetical protein BO72DRAFT_371571 [Aspergillus fijiensis CBS 313.89]
MTLNLELEKSKPVYTNHDHITGHVILEPQASINLSQITVTLSGHSICRIEASGHSESLQLFKETRQVLHRYGEFSAGSKSLTLGSKRYAFPFHVSFPHDPDCHRGHPSDSWESKSQREPPATSRMGQLPPSTGNPSSSTEIVYTLNASVVVGNVFKQSIQQSQQSRRVFYSPTISPQPPPSAMALRRAVVFPCTGASISDTAYLITIELSQGATLSLGQSLPISIQVTRTGPADHNLVLNDYQAMLIEETVTRLRDLTQVQRISRILRTVSNLHHTIFLADTPAGSTVCVSDSLWGGQSLSANIVPSFETSRIHRSYKLEIRLGFNSGPEKVQTRILEIEFPVSVVAIASASLPPTSPPVGARREESLPEGVHWKNMKQ